MTHIGFESLLTDEHKMIRDTARAFSQDKLVPYAAQWDRDKKTPIEIFSEMGELGLLGMLAPEEWGGDTVFIDVSAVTGQGIDDLLCPAPSGGDMGLMPGRMADFIQQALAFLRQHGKGIQQSQDSDPSVQSPFVVVACIVPAPRSIDATGDFAETILFKDSKHSIVRMTRSVPPRHLASASLNKEPTRRQIDQIAIDFLVYSERWCHFAAQIQPIVPRRCHLSEVCQVEVLSPGMGIARRQVVLEDNLATSVDEGKHLVIRLFRTPNDGHL